MTETNEAEPRRPNYQSVALCDDCWDRYCTERPSERKASGAVERCHRCRCETVSGIYLRIDVDAEPPIEHGFDDEPTEPEIEP
jgi:hypothetical protein